MTNGSKCTNLGYFFLPCRIYMDTISPVNAINRTAEFDAWLGGLKDLQGRAKVLVRLKRAELGHWGDCKALGDGLCEMRIDFGPGYRIYFVREGRVAYLLLAGGSKAGQRADIAFAKALWRTIRRERTCVTSRLLASMRPNTSIARK
ncbi:type II toxin-antitoxin system RelE/ParE family toxin [Trinickia caryophylli]|nr:type II toxin-antitoxin system RelE/ParE family toxin [Trinickia caryophylli]WQE15671.1 type II toxin-antitoxin system RelE/ParE family toxin [Trinickia caryophylli]